MYGGLWIEDSIHRFHEHGLQQTFRIEVKCNIWRRFNFSRLLKGSDQGKCMSVHWNSIKVEHDLALIIFVKFGVLFDLMVCRKEVFSESIHRIETHLDLFLEIIEVQSSIAFELCIYEQFISFWWDDIMFEITNYTNLCITSTLQWWSLIVIWYQSFKILGLWWVQLVWWGVLIQNHQMCNNCLDLSKIIACMMRS